MQNRADICGQKPTRMQIREFLEWKINIYKTASYTIPRSHTRRNVIQESLFHDLKGAFPQSDKACIRHRESMFRHTEEPVPSSGRFCDVMRNPKYAHKNVFPTKLRKAPTRNPFLFCGFLLSK